MLEYSDHSNDQVSGVDLGETVSASRIQEWSKHWLEEHIDVVDQARRDLSKILSSKSVPSTTSNLTDQEPPLGHNDLNGLMDALNTLYDGWSPRMVGAVNASNHRGPYSYNGSQPDPVKLNVTRPVHRKCNWVRESHNTSFKRKSRPSKDFEEGLLWPEMATRT